MGYGYFKKMSSYHFITEDRCNRILINTIQTIHHLKKYCFCVELSLCTSKCNGQVCQRCVADFNEMLSKKLLNRTFFQSFVSTTTPNIVFSFSDGDENANLHFLLLLSVKFQC